MAKNKVHEFETKNCFSQFFCTRLSEIIKKALKDRESPLREFNTTYKSRFMQKSYINGKHLLHWNMQCTLEYERPGSALTCVYFFLEKGDVSHLFHLYIS